MDTIVKPVRAYHIMLIRAWLSRRLRMAPNCLTGLLWWRAVQTLWGASSKALSASRVKLVLKPPKHLRLNITVGLIKFNYFKTIPQIVSRTIETFKPVQLLTLVYSSNMCSILYCQIIVDELKCQNNMWLMSCTFDKTILKFIKFLTNMFLWQWRFYDNINALS